MCQRLCPKEQVDQSDMRKACNMCTVRSLKLQSPS
jgi:hypothetical protein